jgi:hypothetical protein
MRIVALLQDMALASHPDRAASYADYNECAANSFRERWFVPCDVSTAVPSLPA